MQQKNVIDILQDEFIPYAGEILTNNLPSVSDGLLPVNRKVIYALHKNGVTNDKSYIKMLRASAMAMTYYVYGDLPLTGAMKNMGNNSLNYTYLDPKGSFGDKNKKAGVGASPRYIECKLSKYSEDLLSGINKNIVPTKRNFDNTEDEPICLPSLLPNVLINTSQSIAVGESSKIPAHNLIEVCDSFISYIKTNNISESINIIKGCDLSLGGQIIYDDKEFEKIYTTGRGSFTLLGKYTYDKSESRVTITEIPYGAYVETIEDKIREHFDKGNFKEVVDIHNGSDKDGIKLNIYLKKSADVSQFIAKLRRFTPFESKFACNFTLLDLDGKTPMLMSLEDIIVRWIKHRKTCINNELLFDLDKLNFELNRLNGLKLLLSDLDEAIKIIRSSKSEKEVKEKLTIRFNLNDEQLDYVCQIKLVNMNEEWINKRLANIADLNAKVEDISGKIDNSKALESIIIEQLEESKKKYGKPRMTEVVYDDDNKFVAEVEDYNCNIVITNAYIKKNLRYSEMQKVKDDDEVLLNVPCNNRDKVLVFTNKNNMYMLKVDDIQQCQPSVLGQYLPNVLELESDEKIIYSLVTDENYQGNLVFFYRDSGKVAKTSLQNYKANRRKLSGVYNKSEVPIYINLEKDEEEVVFYKLISSIDKCLIIKSNELSISNSRTASGIYSIRSKKDSYLDRVEKLLETDIVEKPELYTYYLGKTNSIGRFVRKEDKNSL